MAVITIPSALKNKLGDEATEAIVELIKEIDLEARKDGIAIVEERFERRLSEEFGILKVENAKEFGKMRAETAHEIGKLRAEMIKWMFIFWVSQIAAIVALLKFIL